MSTKSLLNIGPVSEMGVWVSERHKLKSHFGQLGSN